MRCLTRQFVCSFHIPLSWGYSAIILARWRPRLKQLTGYNAIDSQPALMISRLSKHMLTPVQFTFSIVEGFDEGDRYSNLFLKFDVEFLHPVWKKHLSTTRCHFSGAKMFMANRDLEWLVANKHLLVDRIERLTEESGSIFDLDVCHVHIGRLSGAIIGYLRPSCAAYKFLRRAQFLLGNALPLYERRNVSFKAGGIHMQFHPNEVAHRAGVAVIDDLCGEIKEFNAGLIRTGAIDAQVWSELDAEMCQRQSNLDAENLDAARPIRIEPNRLLQDDGHTAVALQACAEQQDGAHACSYQGSRREPFR